MKIFNSNSERLTRDRQISPIKKGKRIGYGSGALAEQSWEIANGVGRKQPKTPHALLQYLVSSISCFDTCHYVAAGGKNYAHFSSFIEWTLPNWYVGNGSKRGVQAAYYDLSPIPGNPSIVDCSICSTQQTLNLDCEKCNGGNHIGFFGRCLLRLRQLCSIVLGIHDPDRSNDCSNGSCSLHPCGRFCGLYAFFINRKDQAEDQQDASHYQQQKGRTLLSSNSIHGAILA